MPLNDTDLAVIAAEVITQTDKQATEYLKEQGYKMSERTYKRKKKAIHEKDTERLYELAKSGKENQMNRIDEFNTIKNELWKICRDSKDENVKLRALRQIRDISPFISAAEAAVPYIIKEVIKNFGKDHEDQIPSLSTLDGTGT